VYYHIYLNRRCLNVRGPCTKKHACTETVIDSVNYFHTVTTNVWKIINISKYVIHDVYWFTFLHEVTRLYLSVSLTLAFLSSLSFTVFTICIFLIFTVHSFMFIVNIPSFFLIFLQNTIPPSIHCIRYTRLWPSFLESHSSSTLGFFVVPVGVKTWSPVKGDKSMIILNDLKRFIHWNV
jgi:hypothetical protein